MPTNPKYKPGIHLYKTEYPCIKTEYYWHLVSSNGRIIARSSETYTRKGNAAKSIITAATIFEGGKRPWELIPYYDHTGTETLVKYC